MTPAQTGHVAWTVLTLFVMQSLVFVLVALSAFSTRVCGWRTAPDGALSVVLKSSKLEGSAIDAGIPARKIKCKSNAKAVEEDDVAIGFF